MGWEWRVFYNLRREGHLTGTHAHDLPSLLNLPPFQNDGDGRADEYFLIDFPATPTASATAGEEGTETAAASSPADVGLKLRGGQHTGLELKLRLQAKKNLKCEKWKKYRLVPDQPVPESVLQNVHQGPEACTALLNQYYNLSLSPHLPLSSLSVKGIAKISKERGQQTVNGVLLEHTLVRLESNTLPGVVVLADTLALGGSKDEIKAFLSTQQLNQQSETVQGLVMGYPELLFKLFVSKEVKI